MPCQHLGNHSNRNTIANSQKAVIAKVAEVGTTGTTEGTPMATSQYRVTTTAVTTTVTSTPPSSIALTYPVTSVLTRQRNFVRVIARICGTASTSIPQGV